MTLIVEDGSLVSDADSYISLDDARTYAESRGLSLNADDDEAEIQLRIGFDYLEAITSYKGVITSSAQMTSWPRDGVYINGYPVAADYIPPALKYAQVQVAVAVEAGLDPTPNATGDSFVIQEKVGSLETKYSEAVSTSGVPILRSVEKLLAPLVTASGPLTVARA
jgi:hypothetical protein